MKNIRKLKILNLHTFLLLIEIIISFTIFYLFRVPVGNAETSWYVTAIDRSTVYGYDRNNGCNKAELRDSYNYRIQDTRCLGFAMGLTFDVDIPNGTYYVAILDGSNTELSRSEFFTVDNGVLTNSHALPTPKPAPTLSETQMPSAFTVYAYHALTTLITTLGPSFCDEYGWDVYNLNLEKVSHINTCGGNGEVLGINTPLPNGNYFVYGYFKTDFANNIVYYGEYYSKVFKIYNNAIYLNQPPVVSPITITSTPTLINTQITASADFSDFIENTHTGVWNWGDGTTNPAIINEISGVGSASAVHTYTQTGTFNVSLILTDDEGGQTMITFESVEVYSPTNQGIFVGAKFFTSPLGAYSVNPLFNGQAKFSIKLQYDGNLPAGNISMDLKNQNFVFNSTSIDTFIISSNLALVKGHGTINGAGLYNFLITGIDMSGPGTQDRIRYQIKNIFDNIIYDTQLSAPNEENPTTVINGNLIIHE